MWRNWSNNVLVKFCYDRLYELWSIAVAFCGILKSFSFRMSIFIVTSITANDCKYTHDSRLLKEIFNLSSSSIVSTIFVNLILVLSWKSANEKHKVKGFRLSIPYL